MSEFRIDPVVRANLSKLHDDVLKADAEWCVAIDGSTAESEADDRRELALSALAAFVGEMLSDSRMSSDARAKP